MAAEKKDDFLRNIQLMNVRPQNVCVCKMVPYGVIEKAVKDGARTFEEIQKITTAGTGCGTCRSRIEEIIERYR